MEKKICETCSNYEEQIKITEGLGYCKIKRKRGSTLVLTLENNTCGQWKKIEEIEESFTETKDDGVKSRFEILDL